MNKKFNISLSKGKVSSLSLMVIALVVLAVILGVASWFTIKRTLSTSENIKKVKSELDVNRALVTSLEKLRANSDYYIKQRDEYDKIIAEAGSYNSIDYYIELDEMCSRYELEIVEISVGELESSGSVKSATTNLAVTGSELNVRKMAAEIVSQPEIARIDAIAMTDKGDGTVEATMTIVNFTK